MHWLTNLESTISQNWQSFDWRIAVLVFLAYIFLDIMYVRYMFAVVNKRAIAAANTGSLMYVFMAFGIFNYTHNFLYVISVGLGSWLGTYVVVAREKSKRE